MIDSTNPRVMADNIRYLSGDISALRATVVALGTYSTTEFDTGKKWIDGSTIYGLVIVLDSTLGVSYTSWTETSIDSPGDMYIFASGFSRSSKSYQGSLLAHNIAGKLNLQTAKNATANIDIIYLEYIKALSGLLAPAPDDTRSIESEPETEPINEELKKEEK